MCCYFNIPLIVFAYNGCSLLSLIDINECSASIRVCDVNAICRNTRGYYVCSCKPGKTCSGKNIWSCVIDLREFFTVSSAGDVTG